MTLKRRHLLLGAGAAALGLGAYKLGGPGGRVVDGRSRARPVLTTTRVPARTDAVIIGGGIVGAMTAYYLAARGVSVALCEKGAIAGEASGRATGRVSSAGLDRSKMEIIGAAKERWKHLNTEIQGESGYRVNGSISAFVDENTGDYWSHWLTQNSDLEPAARILSGKETAALLGNGRDWAGAYFNPDDGSVEPTLAAPAVATAAARLGAQLIAPCAVRGLETEAGRVTHVITEHGTIRTAAVVLAGGCWSSLFAGSLGLHLPALNVFSMGRQVGNVEGPEASGNTPSVGWRRRIDGTYTISVAGGRTPIVPRMFKFGWDFREAFMGAHWDLNLNLSSYFLQQLITPSNWAMDEKTPFEYCRVMEPTVNTEIAERAVRDIVKEVPAFRTMQLGSLWSGALVVTPDNMPTLSTVRSMPGLYLATGFTYGMTMGPAAGKLMADLVTGSEPEIDPAPYRYERYIDGTKLHFTY